MKLLLDTHALLWWMAEDDRLAPKARELIADPANDILVSVVSLWEIAVKVRVGKLEADVDDIAAACDESGFTHLGITQPHLRTLVQLAMHHRDPFDHLLIAQGLTEQATFLSDSRNALRYPISTISCSGDF